ncbi:hypothetical protein OAJ60_01605 [Planctomycetaceae bacterium]|nr:hypothetical protein [Planctomycetaceae bacterium]
MLGLTITVSGMVVALAGGCSDKTFKIETRINSDGTIDRAICQPGDSLPGPPGHLHDGWDETRVVGWPSDDTPIRQMKLVDARTKKGKEANYFAGWGRFKDVADIPDHFVVHAEGLDRQGRLVRNFQHRDLGLVVEYAWKETLTDVIKLDDRLRARDLWTSLFIDLTIATLEHRFGKTYRFESLETWARKTAAAVVADFLELDLEFALRRREPDETELENRLLLLLARHDLMVTGPDGKLLKMLDEEDFEEKVLTPFVRRLLRQHVRDAEGESLGEDAVEEILAWLPLVGAPEEPGPAAIPAAGLTDGLTDGPADGPADVLDGSRPPTRLEISWEAVVIKRFGSEKAFEKRSRHLSARIWGVYRTPFLSLQGGRNFVVSLQLPGDVVETSGTITGAGEVAWRFPADKAFPSGYRMDCRSLEIRPEAAELLKHFKPADRRKVLLKLVRLIPGGDDPLLVVLRSSAARKSWSPLMEYRRSLDRKKQAAEVKRLDGLYRLLQLPLSGSGRVGT